MKRFVSCLAFAMLALGARAQYGDLYYHRVGDTIEQNPNNGYFEWWDWDQMYESNELVHVWTLNLYPITLVQYYTPTSLKVVGLAASIYALDLLAPPYHWVTQTPKQEYLFLYEADASGVHKVGELPYNLEDPHRHLELKYHRHTGYDTMCCRYAPYSEVLPLYEYYFDSAITVSDSFYVGVSVNSRNIQHGENDTMPMYAFYTNSPNRPNTNCKDQYVSGTTPCLIHSVTLLSAQLPNLYTMDTLWTYYSTDAHLILYPIVEMDTTLPPADMCVGVEGVQASLSGDCLTVSWDSWPRYTTLQLRYGPIGIPQSEWDTVEVTGSTYTVCGVDTSQSHYGISLRAYCQSAGDTTDWSHLVWIPMVQSTNDIDDAGTPLAASVTVSPNPSTGMVAVTSHHPLSRIEVVNTRGMLVYSEPAQGHRETIDLTVLPAGTYVVSVRTIAGTTCKRMVKQ